MGVEALPCRVPESFLGSRVCALSFLYPVFYLFALCCTNLARTPMKSLLRKRSPTDPIPRPSPPSAPAPTPAQKPRQPPSNVETPLYARFATFRPAVQPHEKARPVVSGPMPLGRPTRTNPEATEESRRKHEDAALLRRGLSSDRQGTTSDPQSMPSSLATARDDQPSLDRSYQDARGNLPQAARPPIKAQTSCKQCAPFFDVFAISMCHS
jgi:hypothetical protein